ncbi:MAG: von Willebrand factor type A domain-containing protein [Pseudomonadota bacterium]
MKRFLKHDKYELGDRDRESLWHDIRRELKPAGRPSLFRTVRPWPALTTAVTVVALAALGVWWIDSNRTDMMGAGHPGLLGKRPGEVVRKAEPAPLKYGGKPLADEVVEIDQIEESASAAISREEKESTEGAEYMVEVKSAVTEHSVRSETFEKHAIDSVDDALSKKAGVVSRAGELYVRGGRSGEVSMQTTGVAGSPSPTVTEAPGKARQNAAEDAPPGSVTGGTKPPNDEQVELMYFEHVGVNPFVATEDDSLSTFAVDVDNASWTVARNYLDRGLLPPADGAS